MRMDCLQYVSHHISGEKRKLFVLGNFTIQDDVFFERRTWLKASKLCKMMKATLPLIKSREDLEDLVFFLQKNHNLPPIQALFIGLNYHPGKVSLSHVLQVSL